MTQKKYIRTYTSEFRDRGIRLFKENRANYPSDNAVYRAIQTMLPDVPNEQVLSTKGP